MKRTSAPLLAAFVLLLFPLGYVGSYLAIAQPGWEICCCTHGGDNTSPADTYRFGGQWSERLFWPLEQLDRRLRPGVWEHESDQRLQPNRGRSLELFDPWQPAVDPGEADSCPANGS